MLSRFLILLVLLIAVPVTASAQQSSVEFSADLVQSMPQGGTQKGKLYIGTDQVRTEFTINDRTMVQIIDAKRQQAIMLDPQQRTYMLRKAAQGSAQGAPTGSAADSPCAGMQNISCRQLGVEKINGRPAQKWEFLSKDKEGESSRMLTWLDEERRMPLRQIMPDGASMEMRMLGHEQVNGRGTEKWEMSTKRSGEESESAFQWYDPQLKFNVREEQPGGFSRELKNIKPGKQPAWLFQVPDGFTEFSASKGNSPQQGQK